MTQEQLKKAESINEEIETLQSFLNTNHKCWGMLRIFHTPKHHFGGISVKTAYGAYQEEVTCSKRLSESITKAIKNEISVLQSELDGI